MDQEISIKQGQPSDDARQFVCFNLAEEEYGISIQNVHEVIRVPRITPVPQMPDFVLGVVNIRGKVIPVFDLRKKFALPVRPFDGLTKIVVCTVHGGTLISIVIDNILDNLTLPSNKIDPTPSTKMKIDRDCVLGLGVLEARMIVILDLEKVHDELLDSINASSAKKVKA